MCNSGFDPDRLANIGRHFASYVEDGRLPGWQVQVSRHGEIAYQQNYGLRDVEAGLPVTDDTVFRIYSMTKPITSVATMMLFEEGRMALTDPVSKYIPAFAHMNVLAGGTALKPVLRPTLEPIRIFNLLNHTSGLGYGFHHVHVQDEMYRNAGFEWSVPEGCTLEQAVEAWAALPLRFNPGSCWNYSVSTDVLGRVIEVISGQSLDTFFQERIFEPLGMVDTAFALRADMRERLAALYVPDQEGKAARNNAFGDAARRPAIFLSGGGGLLSTTADYHRFTRMLLGEGALGNVRLLGSRSVRYMTKNTLPGGQDLKQFGIPLFSTMRMDGLGFGLGFSVLVDPMAQQTLGSVGEYAWGGAASTAFWIDPVEQITVIFMTQLLPSSTHPIRPQLRQLVYSALVD